MKDLEIPLYQAFVSLHTDCKEIDQALERHGLTRAQYLSVQKAHPKWVRTLKDQAAAFVDELAREVDGVLLRQREHAQQQAEKELVALTMPAVERLKSIIEDDDQPSTRHLSAIKLLSHFLKQGFVAGRVESDQYATPAPAQQIDPHQLDLTDVTITVKSAKSNVIDVTPASRGGGA